MSEFISKNEMEFLIRIKNQPDDRATQLEFEAFYNKNIEYFRNYFYRKFKKSNLDFYEVYCKVLFNFFNSVRYNKFHFKSSIKTFICKILDYTVLNMIRDNKSIVFTPNIPEVPHDGFFEANDTETSFVNDVLKIMEPNCQQIITMLHFEGKRHKEIAEIFNIKETSSKNMISRCFQKLRETLSNNPKLRENFKKYYDERF
jgi:RNA polymerase sigma factor (sigma-70 family)